MEIEALETVGQVEIKQTFQCYYCREVLGFDVLKPHSLVKSTGRGKCKPCHREYSRNYHLKRRCKILPKNFMDCDDCDRTFSVYESGGGGVFSPRKKRIACPFCQSEEIIGHMEKIKN